MTYSMVSFPVTFGDFKPRFQVIAAIEVLCAQFTRDLFAIAKLLFHTAPALDARVNFKSFEYTQLTIEMFLKRGVTHSFNCTSAYCLVTHLFY